MRRSWISSFEIAWRVEVDTLIWRPKIGAWVRQRVKKGSTRAIFLTQKLPVHPSAVSNLSAALSFSFDYTSCLILLCGVHGTAERHSKPKPQWFSSRFFPPAAFYLVSRQQTWDIRGGDSISRGGKNTPSSDLPSQDAHRGDTLDRRDRRNRVIILFINYWAVYQFVIVARLII
jgi:hypothetical protein